MKSLGRVCARHTRENENDLPRIIYCVKFAAKKKISIQLHQSLPTKESELRKSGILPRSRAVEKYGRAYITQRRAAAAAAAADNQLSRSKRGVERTAAVPFSPAVWPRVTYINAKYTTVVTVAKCQTESSAQWVSRIAFARCVSAGKDATDLLAPRKLRARKIRAFPIRDPPQVCDVKRCSMSPSVAAKRKSSASLIHKRKLEENIFLHLKITDKLILRSLFPRAFTARKVSRPIRKRQVR